MSINSEGREHVRGAEENVFNLVAHSSTSDAWGQWLQAPLELAASQGDRALALQLVAAGVSFGTAVHAAIRGRHADLATDLLEKGAPTSATDRAGKTPLHVAARLNNPAVVRSLLLLPNSNDDGDQVAAVAEMMGALTNKGLSSLYIAASKGCVEVLRVMIEHGGAHINIRNADGRTALHGAAREGKVEAIDMLVQAGADVEAVATRIYIGTPLDDAASSANAASITALLKHGAAVESSADQPNSPLLRLVQTGRPTLEALLPLIHHGADVNSRDVDDETSLHQLCYRASTIPEVVEIVELLLRLGADETCLSYDVTPLDRLLEHNSAEAESVNRVRRLLESAPADRAWRRRGFMVLCRAFPDRVRLNPAPRTDGGADSRTHGAAAATKAFEPRSSRRRTLDVPAAGGGDGGGSDSSTGSSNGSSGSSEQAEGGSGREAGEGGGWNRVVAAWVMETGEEAIFRNIVLFL